MRERGEGRERRGESGERENGEVVSDIPQWPPRRDPRAMRFDFRQVAQRYQWTPSQSV